MTILFIFLCSHDLPDKASLREIRIAYYANISSQATCDSPNDQSTD